MVPVMARMLTRYADNNIHNLQQEVQNTLLSLKLRIVEEQIAFIQNEMKSGHYNEDETMSLVAYLTPIIQCRRQIAERLNIVISK